MNSTSSPNPIPTLRWGILSTARIIRRNWPGMRDSGAGTLVALASRDAAKAERFIDEMQAIAPWPVRPVAHGSYESLLESADVDAVYIPLPTGVRKEWVMRAAAAGKHVLCEKPCAVNAADLKEMIDCCEKHGVMFMDGVMFMHDPRFVRLREILDDGETVGPLKRITSSFSFRAGEDFALTDIRGASGLEPTGCLGDLGWYCLRASLWAMNWRMPTRVSGRILDSVTNPDSATAIMGFSAELDFPDGVTAAFYCSFLSPDQKWLSISGTKGNLRVPDFVSPAPGNDTDWEINYHRVERSGEAGMNNEARMFACFAETVCAGAPDRSWAEISLKTQILLDACELSAKLGRPVTIEESTFEIR
ncbi:MAG: Gfo/Idh/MocA family oxidoreductase [Luteolibacter sp.]|uniref:Gfo/Idh/MocA family protein n=1 Tax=Luteolibacter sp. TaxID=1962973 RepID=UPI0032655720